MLDAPLLYLMMFIVGFGCFVGLLIAIFVVWAICSETKRAIKERLVWK